MTSDGEIKKIEIYIFLDLFYIYIYIYIDDLEEKALQ